MKNTRAPAEMLGELHLAVAESLLAKVSRGEATPAEINAAIKFLQNNNIMGELTPDSPESKLKKALPQFDEMTDDDM